MQITTYRVEHARHAMGWNDDDGVWLGESRADYWTEWDEEHEAIQVADAIGGIVVEINRPMHYGDIVRHQQHYMQAAE